MGKQGVMFIVTPVVTTVRSVYLKAQRFIDALAAASVSRQGAFDVSVSDSAGYFSTSTVEGVLAELGVALKGTTITDPGNAGAIPVTRSGSVPIVTAGAETRTLAIPTFVNQRLVIYFQTDGGNCVITSAQAINAAGNTVITLADVDDSIQLVAAYNGTALRWRVASNDGATLS